MDFALAEEKREDCNDGSEENGSETVVGDGKDNQEKKLMDIIAEEGLRDSNDTLENEILDEVAAIGEEKPKKKKKKRKKKKKIRQNAKRRQDGDEREARELMYQHASTGTGTPMAFIGMMHKKTSKKTPASSLLSES